MGREEDFSSNEFLDLLPEVVFEIDSNLHIKFLNKACENVLGYKKSDIINNKLPVDQFVSPSDLHKLNKSIQNNFNGSHISGNSYTVYDKEGNERIFEIYNTHIKKNGKIDALRCIAIDITEKEKRHKILTSQEKHFRQIFQNFPLPYQSLNNEGEIIDVNPAWEELMGYSRTEIVGKHFEYILTEPNKSKFKKAFNIFKEKGIVSNVSFELMKKDGSTMHANYHGKIEYSDQKKFIRSHCVFSDITLQKKAENTLIRSEERLRELNATKDKFFSIIAHDLKNPFNDLMGFTQLLALNIDKYDKQKIEQFTHIIHQSSKLAYNLLENLLDWSRSQTGTLKFKPEKISISELISENIDLLESTARNKNIRIYSEVNGETFAFADKNMVRTILRNLISNAIKYTNQGGHIRIVGNCSKTCKISVSDSGIGISSENIKKIFKIDESFSTLGTEREKGTGLGLILCKEFVEKNGGRLKIKSRPNEGSTFIFTLPLPDANYQQ
ncbi:MAG: PAS domain-containing sensor histidine kinase [Bacteroidetes bacterium]|nr:PAS domain-containing sensor histidine kinase [Bacteroidota bacterium]